MDRSELLELWNDMWKEGNWVPSWPDSLEGLTAETANWSPDPKSNTIWQEVAHVLFWRQVTLDLMAGKPKPSSEEVELRQFAAPESKDEASWTSTVESLQSTQVRIAEAIQNDSVDISRVPYHLIHDAYHLGRVTQLRTLQGTAPKF